MQPVSHPIDPVYCAEFFIENRDVFQYTLQFVEASDACVASAVCKTWEKFFRAPALWHMFSAREGLPMVQGTPTPGQKRNCRRDYRVLESMTVSGKTIGKYLGKVIGPIPCISAAKFDSLWTADPFESAKLGKETFKYIVDAPMLEITCTKNRPLALDDNGCLIEIDPAQCPEEGAAEAKVLRVSLCKRNIVLLCKYPLAGHENLPVFDYVNPKIFEQDTCPESIGVYFMRKHIPDASRNKSFPAQKVMVEQAGLEVSPLRIRMLFDALMILQHGACPDDKDSWARTADTVHYSTNFCQAFVGGFSLGSGANVNSSAYVADLIGVAPGGPAEVLPATHP